MGNQDGVTRLEFGRDGLAVVGNFLGSQRARLLGIQMSLDQKTFGNLGHIRRTC
ncbi:hypothetical protein D3C78_1644890 [compost metagenome]